MINANFFHEAKLNRKRAAQRGIVLFNLRYKSRRANNLGLENSYVEEERMFSSPNLWDRLAKSQMYGSPS